MFASPKRSALISGLLHAGAIALVLLITNTRTSPIPALRAIPIAREIGPYVPLVPHKSKGGGGGGMRDPGPARKGDLPRRAYRQFVPPTLNVINFNPRLAVEPAIVADPQIAMPVAQIGDPNGILSSLYAGPGSGSGIGTGRNGGIGPGDGPGAGSGDGTSGVTGRPGMRGVVVTPALLAMFEPEYTEEARRAKIQGTVILRLEINDRGQAQNIVIQQRLGLGLDERAIEAVRRWRFRAGTVDGKPVTMTATVEVNFQLL